MQNTRSLQGSAQRLHRRYFGSVAGVLCICGVFALAVAMAPRLAMPTHAQTASRSSGDKYFVYVGTYTSSGPAKDTGSKGIYVYRFNSSTGDIQSVGLAAQTDQPSFLAVDPGDKFLFAANESDTYQGQPTGGVSAFSMNRSTGMLSFLNEVPSRGAGPAHITVDHTGKFALASNYDGGNLAVFAIHADGRLGDASDFVQHHGSSVNKNRQAGPHVHEIVVAPDNRFALSTDLGLDELFVYPFDSNTGKLGDPRIIKLAPGLGPRHLAFSPDGKFVYLVSEMGSAVTVLSYAAKEGAMTVIQTVNLAPENENRQSAAEIAVGTSGKYLYASNRGDDFLAVYSIQNDTGQVTRTETVPLDGKTPRDFAIDPTGHWLWDANQDSGNIIVFRIDQQTGKLLPSGMSLKVPAPTCVLFVPAS
jgi:6-phosphogluconolactonase